MIQEEQSIQLSAYIADILCKQLFPLINEPLSILDFGCGDGLITYFMHRAFTQSKVFGVDNDKILIENNNKDYSDISFIWAESTPLPFDSQCFDLIYAVNVFHHLPSQQHQVLKDLVRMLKPSGSLIIFEYNPYNIRSRLQFKQDHSKSQLPMISAFSLKKLCSDLNVNIKITYLYPNLEQRFFYNDFIFSRAPLGPLYKATITKS